ncbi:MAG TPA: DUF2892 domain-containing protein [Anaeromyxobacteraceae bacterium]|nr:DUF2892 domain-containing protein [Anaeromyxobacteraceae bacterium]
MTTERIVRIVAGSFVLLALALGAPASPLFVSAWFLWLAVFVGANLAQSGMTRFCPLEIFLKMGGVKTAEQLATERAARPNVTRTVA